MREAILKGLEFFNNARAYVSDVRTQIYAIFPTKTRTEAKPVSSDKYMEMLKKSLAGSGFEANTVNAGNYDRINIRSKTPVLRGKITVKRPLIAALESVPARLYATEPARLRQEGTFLKIFDREHENNLVSIIRELSRNLGEPRFACRTIGLRDNKPEQHYVIAHDVA